MSLATSIAINIKEHGVMLLYMSCLPPMIIKAEWASKSLNYFFKQTNIHIV